VSDGSDIQLPDGRWMSTVKGDIFRVDEWYGCRREQGQPTDKGLKMLATEITAGIIDIEIKNGWRNRNRSRIKPGPADSSIFAAENGVSIAVDMNQPVRLSDGKKYRGLSWTRADKRPGSRVTGWELIREYLKAAIPPETGVREFPGLFICENCHDFINTFPVLPRDPKKTDDVDTDAPHDHPADETRYFIRSQGLQVKQFRLRGMF
jgi:hypothetical protein